jgi:uncharacterized protein (TIGR03067 family)
MQKRILVVVIPTLVFAGSARADEKEMDRVEGFVTRYYLKPDPGRVPAMLDVALKAGYAGIPSPAPPPADAARQTGPGIPVLADPTVRRPAAHAFGHMARNNPKLVRAYEARFAGADDNGKAFLLEALRVCGDELTLRQLDAWSADPAFRGQRETIEKTRVLLKDSKGRLPRDVAARSPSDLDLLWADFLVTGEYAPVARILDTLDRPDSLREKIVERLKKDSKDRDEFLDSLRTVKLIQPGTKDRLVAGDLALALLHDAKGRLRAHALEAAEYLGSEYLGLSAKDLESGLLLQGTAIWSTQSNVGQHPRLAELLNQHYRERPQKSQDLVKRWLSIDQPTAVLDDRSKRLQGTWQAISWDEDGDDLEPKVRSEVLKHIRWTFKDHELETTKAFTRTTVAETKKTEVLGQGGVVVSNYKIATAGKHDVITTTTVSPDEGNESHGIYEINGDTLRVCVKKSGDLPNSLAGGSGTGCILVTLKKVPAN